MAELSFELFNNQLLKVVVGVNDENIRLIMIERCDYGNREPCGSTGCATSVMTHMPFTHYNFIL